MATRTRQTLVERTYAALSSTILLLPVVAVLAAAPATTAGLVQLAGSTAGNRRPNVLIIMSDDQRPGINGMPKTRRMFKRGGRAYRQAFVSVPLCCPSRTTVMTGRFPHNHGVRRNDLANGFPRWTLQKALHAAGYRTGMFGKFLNPWPIAMKPPHFDRWAVSQRGYRDAMWNINGRVGRRSGYNTNIIARHAVQFIESANRPWLMFVTPYAPHEPYTPQTKYALLQPPRYDPNPAMRESDRSDKPRYVRVAGHTYASRGARVRVAQYRTLRSVDDLVGRVQAALRRTGQSRNTLAFYLSDNGTMWGEHGLCCKRVPYTPAVHVPFFVRWPRRIAGGTVSGQLVSLVDIVPTVLRAAGLRARGDGNDLFDETLRRTRLLIEYGPDPSSYVPEWASLRSTQDQYIEYYTDAGTVKFREYYRLTEDPWQLENVLRDGDPGNDPDVGALHGALQAARRCAGTACP